MEETDSHETKGDLEDVALCGKVHEAVYDAARPSGAILEERFLCLQGGVTESGHVEDGFVCLLKNIENVFTRQCSVREEVSSYESRGEKKRSITTVSWN